ncbi:MAG: hypothetical protein H6988_11570 [Pseudomonadales bacterium]|nr:hypothetical protein [Pseudomonadales bacterium]
MATVNETKTILTAEDRTNAAFAAAKSNLEGLTGVAGKFNTALSALGLGVSLGGAAAFVKGTLDMADELSKLSAKTGLAVEDLAGWQHATEQSGLAGATFEKAVAKLNTAIVQTPEKLRSIGVDGNNAQDVLLQLADVFAGISDPTRRAGLAIETFGEKIGPDLLPLLSQGRAGLQALVDQGKALNPITTDAAKAAERFNDALDTLGKRAGSVGRALAVELAEPLAESATALDQLIQQQGLVKGTLAGLGAALLPGVEAKDLTDAARAQREMNSALADYVSMKRWAGSAIGELFPEYSAGRIADAKKRLDDAIAYQRKLQEDSAKETARGAQARLKAGEADEQALTTAAENIRDAFSKSMLGSMDALEKLVDSFPAQRQKLTEEMRRLSADLTGTSTQGATGNDLAGELFKGKTALAGGDAVGVDMAFSRAKEMLKGLKINGGITDEITYYTRELEAFGQAAINAREKVATYTLASLQSEQIRLLGEAQNVDPMKLQVDGQYIAGQVKEAVETALRNLATNPLAVPIAFVPTLKGQSVDIASVATKMGARP